MILVDRTSNGRLGLLQVESKDPLDIVSDQFLPAFFCYNSEIMHLNK